jgi:LacI family transcriptional regulator
MISTREIAALAGVSQATVSRSLNDHPAIAMETKERVRKIARENGYAEQLRDKKAKTIGILMTGKPFFDDLFINYTTNILIQKISAKNHNALPLFGYSSQNNSKEKLRDLLRQGFLEGFIILARDYDEEIHQYLNDVGMPHVYLLHYSRDSVDSIDIVDSDNFSGGYLGTKHLLDYGHRHILTMTSPWREFLDRTSGYRKALSEYGAEIRDDWVLTEECTFQGGYRLIKNNRNLLRQVSAIYAQSDILAFGAIQALKDEGIQVPEDISIIGSDGYELGLYCRPQLDSVAHPIDELTELAVNRLMEMDNGFQAPRCQILRPYVIHRDSVQQK